MAYKRRFRRRRSFLRWFTPNLWNGSSPQLYSSFIYPGGGANEAGSEVALTPLLFGSAPFQGTLNSAGRLAGTMLAERQYFNMKRVVGRMRWYISSDEEFNYSGANVTVWWALVRMNTDDLGQPDAQTLGIFPRLSVRDNQDDKKFILAQDVWRTLLPAGSVATGGHYLELDAEPPLYSLVDKTMKRSFRNEQDIFLATQFGIDFALTGGLPVSGSEFQLKGCLNLRCLGTFGR